MEWGIVEIGQLLLVYLPLGLIVAWVGGWLYRTWRAANMPAILGKLSQSRRRDKTIKTTRERVDALEAWRAESEMRFGRTVDDLRAAEARMSKTESMIAQICQKLRSRGIVTDA